MTATINGTTGINLIQDGTVQQADLAANVVGNGPAFSAYRNSSQTISSFATIACDVEQYDTDNAFAAGIFTASVAGYYQFTGYVANATTACLMQLRFKKNASEYYNCTYSTSTVNSISGGSQIFLNIGDTVEMQVFQGVSQSILTGLSGNYFQGHLARAA